MSHEKLDRFGTPLSLSFVPEYELVVLIGSYGLTVEDAALKRKKGTLPKELSEAWTMYEAEREKNK